MRLDYKRNFNNYLLMSAYCQMPSYSLRCLLQNSKEEALPDFSAWTSKVLGWKKQYDPVTEDMFEKSNIVHPYAFTRILSEEMTSNDILVGDCGGNIVVINHSFETKLG